MSPSTLISTLVLVCGLSALAGFAAQEAQEPQEPQEAAEDAPREDTPAELEAWRALVERDQRLRFTPRTGELARQDLDAGLLNERGRAAALFALGAGREVRERPRLEASVLVGTLLEQRAALFALGDLGLRVDSLLGDELRDPDVAAYAFLALLKRGGVGVRRLVDELARDAAPPVRAAVESLAGFVANPAASRPSDAARLYLELRWEAAAAYGLVDGLAWSTIVLGELLRDQRFLDRTVYLAAGKLDRPGVKDHLISALIEDGGTAVVRACVHAMPDELAQLVTAGLWAPPEGEEGWKLVIEEIEREQLEDDTIALLSLAKTVPAVRVRALALLARAGVSDGLEALSREWAVLSTDERVFACAAWGDSGLEEASAWLVGRLQDPSERVRAAVWIARGRLEEQEAREHVQTVLSDPTDERWDDWLGVALALVHDPWIGGLLDAQLALADTPERVAIAARLVLVGRLTPLDWLRPELREGLPSGELMLLALRAIARRGSGEDLMRLARLFPFEAAASAGMSEELELEVNAALARAMIGDRDVRVLPALRRAMWDDPFDRSVLAALLLIEVAGVHALREEVIAAPLEASARDFRRVGFALGEWAGLDQLQRLQERGRIAPGDPLVQGAFLGAMSGRTQ